MNASNDSGKKPNTFSGAAVPGGRAGYIVLTGEDYRVLGPEDFGGPGLHAIESIGPFVEITATGPIVTVHDSTVDAHLGIGHHPHRFHERLFYIMAGELDHDDALNNIKGHISEGDVGLFTEGRKGMVHSEWNNGNVPTHAYILVYATQPIPEQADFTALRDADAPRYNEGDGVVTKELVGHRSGLRLHGDIRQVTDSTLQDGTVLTLSAEDSEGGLLSIQEGKVTLDGHAIPQGATIVLPPSQGLRSLTVQAAGPARIIRVVHGPGYGFVVKEK